MVKVGILGATGYTALELAKLLLRHPEVSIELLTSRQEDRPHVADIHPSLSGQLDLRLTPFTLEAATGLDCIFSCLPHAASASSVKPLVDRGQRVIDFSADYRITDRDVYEQWYKTEHCDPDRIGKVPYGLPELFREQIRAAPLVANPGCYPTGAILAIAPLLKAKLVSPTGWIIDSKSGVTGAGRSLKLAMLYSEVNENFRAYGVGAHRHMPEIDQILGHVHGESLQVIFTPHLVPMDRGILTTAYGVPKDGVTEAELQSALHEAYDDEPFVQVVDELPATKDVAGSNRCHLTARLVRGRAMVISCIDNLVKGASGAAVQNFNLMFGFDETTALV